MSFLYTTFGIPLGYLMWGIYSVIKNYGLSLIIFTFLTKVVLFPISLKQHRNILKNRIIAPKLNALRKTYANNPQRLQEEQIKLQQEEGLGMNGGCLPAIIQIFLLFGVLDVVYRPLTHILRIGSGAIDSAKKIIETASPDVFASTYAGGLRTELTIMNFAKTGDNAALFNSIGGFSDKVLDFKYTFFNIDFGAIPQFKPEAWTASAVVLFMIPFLAGLSQLAMSIFSQFVQRKTNPDMPKMPGMNALLYISPVISIFISFQVPAGLGFYWIISSLFSIIQSLILYLYYTPERIDAYIASEKEKNKNKKVSPLMQRILEQQKLLNEQNGANRTIYSDEELGKMSKSEINEYNRSRLNEARKRMAEKYGDDYSDDE